MHSTSTVYFGSGTFTESLACRRSVRLQHKDYKNSFIWCVQKSPLGYFSLLPNELLHLIFNTVSIEDLGFLSITSKAVRDVVNEYAQSNTGLKRLQPRNLAVTKRNGCNKRTANTQYDHFKKVGLLLKRITCLFPTRERLKMLEYFTSQVGTRHQLVKYVAQYKAKRPLKLQCVHRTFTCQALTCYGNLLTTFTRGWEERECMRAYITISENQGMTSKILLMLSMSPGSTPAIEMRIRRFLRHVLLDQCKTMEDLSMWLHFILKPFPMVHQARILYLLYGPLRPGTDSVSWDCMGETSVGERETRSRTITPLGEIAMALKALVTHSEWTDDDVISVLEELTACPDEWLIANTARLLILCGEPIALKVLGSKAINGKMNELGRTILAFSLVLYDEGLRMSWLINVVQQLYNMMKNSQDAKSFLSSITAAYKDYIIMAMAYPPEEEEVSNMQLHHVAMAQADFMQIMMLKLFSSSP